MAIQVDISDVRTRFDDWISRVRAGDEVVISESGEPVAKLTAVAPVASSAAPAATPRVPGSAKGQFEVTDAFFEPLPDDLMRAFNGEDDAP